MLLYNSNIHIKLKRKMNNVIIEKENLNALKKVENTATCSFDHNIKQYLNTEAPNTYTKSIWVWDPKGLCKSSITSYIESTFNKNDVFYWKCRKKYQEGYENQMLCVIEDFKGTIPYSDLLHMADSYCPFTVKIKYQHGRTLTSAFCSKRIIINSKISPEVAYRNSNLINNFDQLYRRFKVIKINNVNDIEALIPEICEHFKYREEDIIPEPTLSKKNQEIAKQLLKLYKDLNL